MGFEYDSQDDYDLGADDDKQAQQFQSKMMKLSIEQLKLRVQGQKKSKENPE